LKIFQTKPKDDINDGYENLRTLVLNYLGVANQEQQNHAKKSQQQQTLQIQRQLSTLQSSRPKTHDKNIEDSLRKEYTDFNMPRSGRCLIFHILFRFKKCPNYMKIHAILLLILFCCIK
jgi:hypothetical protein